MRGFRRRPAYARLWRDKTARQASALQFLGVYLAILVPFYPVRSISGARVLSARSSAVAAMDDAYFAEIEFH